MPYPNIAKTSDGQGSKKVKVSCKEALRKGDKILMSTGDEVVPQLGHRRFRIVIVNNGGGRIFSRVASLQALDSQLRERIIENTHDIRFDHWAAMWNIDVTELRPDAEASKRVWQRYDELWV